jgi:hypothetical protein
MIPGSMPFRSWGGARLSGHIAVLAETEAQLVPEQILGLHALRQPAPRPVGTPPTSAWLTFSFTR